ncbi:MAG TPA: 16S rRNA (cytosine(967)-C(5))-methyltransferase, partial [Gammaproteobacteria bacterium]|nr:16S rRNA (cytosine(967)-C(5))-methyltransferase [Gammaproteobacteria bacterium]
MKPRQRALGILRAVLLDGRSLTDALADAPDGEGRDTALVRALCFGVCRHYFHLHFLLEQLLDRPLRRKDRDVELAALLGLFQLGWLRTPDHAAVAETVALATALKKPWARGLLNA